MEKHLHYYTQHSQYSEPTDKPAVSYCELEDEVHYTTNNFSTEVVDLGSAGIWCTCNLGATSPEGQGLYFRWGETEGYQNSTELSSASTYKYLNGSTWTKYNTTDRLLVLLDIDDAAVQMLGSGYHIPTEAQFNTLMLNTTQQNSTVNGVKGVLFTSNSNSNTLFIPIQYGYIYSNNFNSPFLNSSLLMYWTSEVSLDDGDPWYPQARTFIYEDSNEYLVESVLLKVGSVSEVI